MDSGVLSNLSLFLSTALVGMLLSFWVVSQTLKIRRRGRLCPRCDSTTLPLVPGFPISLLGRRILSRWCPGCGWRGLARRPPWERIRAGGTVRLGRAFRWGPPRSRRACGKGKTFRQTASDGREPAGIQHPPNNPGNPPNPPGSRVRPRLGFRWKGLFLALLSPFCLEGCAPSEDGGVSPQEAAEQRTQEVAGSDSLPGPVPPDQDTFSGVRAPGAFPPPPSPGPPEQEGDSALAGSLDTLPAPEQSVQDRLDRLESENDSLRAAMGVLVDLLAEGSWGQQESGSPPGPGTAAADTAGLAQEILAVDAQQVQNWGLRIVVAVAFLLLTGLVIRMVIWVLDKLAEQNAKRRLFFKRLVPIARISLWFLAILFVAMIILRIEAQGLIAAGAAVGVAVGFAAQDILKNIFGGLIVLFDQPFQVGDKISVAGTYGEVVSIGLRSTRIVTPDDNLVSVPNAQVVDGQVANANAGELNCQVVTDLYLPGWVDETRAKRIAFEAATGSKYVFLNKPIVVLVKDEFKETFLTHLKVKAYVLDPRYEFLFMSDVTERARAGFRKAGLLGPMHGVRAYIDLDRVASEEEPNQSDRESEG